MFPLTKRYTAEMPLWNFIQIGCVHTAFNIYSFIYLIYLTMFMLCTIVCMAIHGGNIRCTLADGMQSDAAAMCGWLGIISFHQAERGHTRTSAGARRENQCVAKCTWPIPFRIILNRFYLSVWQMIHQFQQKYYLIDESLSGRNVSAEVPIKWNGI